jgi:3-hydroxy-9,10-secoandrosta-1,3,5(10)-triene-9,17-dione monooxygenase
MMPSEIAPPLERWTTLASRLRDRATDAERERRIPLASIHELARAGVFRAFTPARFGGDESGLLPVFDGLTTLAQGCGSTGWVAGLLVIHSFFVTLFDDRAQRELWADGPDLRVASSVAPSGTAARVPGGFTLSGHWMFTSGVDHCRWAILNALVSDARRPPVPHLFLVPATDYLVQDDWYVTGLRGTGSKSVHVADAFVPDHRVESLGDLSAGTARGIRQAACWLAAIPWQPLFTYAFAPPAVGTALATVAAFRDQVLSRRSAYTRRSSRDLPTMQVRVARSSAEVDAAQTVMRRDLQELEDCARAGLPLPAASLERMLFDVAYVVDVCARAVDRLFRASGGRALYDHNPLQRLFRDMHAITQHAAVDLDAAGERYGKWLLPKSDTPDERRRDT